MKYRLDAHQSRPGLAGELILDGMTHDLNDFTGVFNRMMDVFSLPEMKSPTETLKLEDIENQNRLKTIHQVFQDWLEVTRGRSYKS